MKYKKVIMKKFSDMEMKQIQQLLEKYGFKRTDSTNEFEKDKTYKALIWGHKTTLVKYSPCFGRFLWSTTFTDINALEKELRANHS